MQELSVKKEETYRSLVSKKEETYRSFVAKKRQNAGASSQKRGTMHELSVNREEP